MDTEMGKRILDLIDEYRTADWADTFNKSAGDGVEHRIFRSRDDVARDFAQALTELLAQSAGH